MTPMHASIWRFTGDPERLARAYDAFAAELSSRPDRLVLVSPMVGITAFARFAFSSERQSLPILDTSWNTNSQFSFFPYSSAASSSSDFTSAMSRGRL